MKLRHASPFASTLALLALLACGSSTPPPAAAVSAASAASGPSSSTTDAPAPSAGPSAAPSASSDADAVKPIELSPLRARDVTVKVGARLAYAYKSHGSVGYGATYRLDAQSVVRFVSDDVTYDRPDAMRPGMTGGDAGTGRMIFEAISKGTATLEVDELFRGRVEHSTKFTITVE